MSDTTDRGPASDIKVGDTVEVFAHPKGKFDATPPEGGGYGEKVTGTVKEVGPIDLPHTTHQGLRIVMDDGREFDAINYAVTTWSSRAEDGVL